MINWFDMPAEELSGGGQFEIKELSATKNGTFEKSGEVYNKVTVNVPQPTGKITITENGTDINVSQYATADVNVSGGGGGDFSTAEVTVVGTRVTVVGTSTLEIACIMNTQGLDVIYAQSLVTGTYQAVLYKGHIYIPTNDVPTLSGNATFENGMIIITGDCTITFA